MSTGIIAIIVIIATASLLLSPRMRVGRRERELQRRRERVVGRRHEEAAVREQRAEADRTAGAVGRA